MSNYKSNFSGQEVDEKIGLIPTLKTKLSEIVTLLEKGLDSKYISDGAITTQKLRLRAVTNDKIAPSAVGTQQIATKAVNTLRIADDAVTTVKIENGAVTSDKIRDGAVTLEKLSEDALNYIDENKSDINLENGTGANSIQQPPEPEAELWTPVNERATEFLQSKNYTTEDGVAVKIDDKTGKYKVGAFGKNSAMLGAKSQTVGGKTFTAGSKCIAFENNAVALGNATLAGGKHSTSTGNETVALGNAAFSKGGNTIARGDHSEAGGFETEANGMGADANGKKTKANGDYSESSGILGEANGLAAHKEGGNNISEGDYSHTEGSETIAGNVNTHSEGHMCFSFGEQSHSEGNRTIAGIRGFNITMCSDDAHSTYLTLDSVDGIEVGDVVSVIDKDKVYVDVGTITRISDNVICLSGWYQFYGNFELNSDHSYVKDKFVNTLFIRKKPSLGTKVVGHHNHSAGYGTIAAADCQNVRGKFNKIDVDAEYLDMVGNGTDNDHRSNAYTLDKNGNAYYAGDMEVSAAVIRSSTPGSNKKFKLTIDDSGTISVSEV